MVSKKNKSKIWGFRPHIQGVPWDFLSLLNILKILGLTSLLHIPKFLIKKKL